MSIYQRTDRELVYSGQVVKVYKDTIRFDNGKVAAWDFIDHRGGSAVVPVLPDGRILMVRQHRNAFDSEMLELPAGGVSEGEERRICALRELEEETGYRAGRIFPLVEIKPNVAISGEIITVFLCTELQKTETHWDEDECIELLSFDIEELFQMVLRNEVSDAKTVSGILAYYGLLKSGSLNTLTELSAEYE